jgi:signal transduction histidine kinase
MVQELLMNISKHTGTSKATVQIKAAETTISIQADDNANGFREAQLQPLDGIGLQTIRYKVSLFSGNMDISSENGTLTSIRIPRQVD